MNKSYEASIIATIIVILYFLCDGLKNISSEYIIVRCFVLLRYVISGIAIIFSCFIFKKIYFKPALIVMITIGLGTLCSILTTNYLDRFFAELFLGLPVAYLIITNKLNYKLLKSFLILVTLFYVSCFVRGIDFNNIYNGVSRNIVSVHMMISTILFYISSLQNGKDIKIWPATMSLFLSIIALGRVGVISSFILVIGAFSNGKISKIKIWIGVIIATIGVKIYFAVSLELGKQTILDRFESSGFSDLGRTNIISEYINNSTDSFMHFIFGAQKESLAYYSYFNNNFHNSYLNLHFNFGILGVLIVFLLVLNTLIYFLRSKNYLLFFCFLSLLVRIATDSLAFTGLLDPIILFFIVTPIIVDKKIISYITCMGRSGRLE